MAGRDVTLCDVGPRDGLQNEAVVLAPEMRAGLCRRLAAAGLSRVEVASFVNPRRVPAMAGAEDVVAALRHRVDTTWTGLVLNERGFERAVAAGLQRINYVVPATNAFANRNQGSTRAAAERLTATLAEHAHASGARLTVTLAVAFGCPFAGRVPQHQIIAAAERAAASGADEVVLADTIGVAQPAAVRRLLTNLADSLGVPVGVHFHDTRQMGVANTLAAVESGVRLIDASVGGTGGCPFAPGATGNVATESIVVALEDSGVRTGVDVDALIACSSWLALELSRAATRAGREPEHAATSAGFR